MKIIFLLAFTAVVSAGCSAKDTPVVGLLELVPVVGRDMHVVARPSYIFTNTKLASPTVFTGLQSDETSTSTICCFEVDNLNAIPVSTILSKYAYDEQFVARIKSIKGYNYIYETHPAAKNLWNQFMKNITLDTHDPMDSHSFSAPVIAATIRKDLIPNTFVVNHNKVAIRTDYQNNSEVAVYTFIIDGQKSTLSEKLPSVE